MNYTRHLLILCGFGLGTTVSRAQAPAPGAAAGQRVYLGLEGIIFANRLTQLSQSGPYVSAADKDLTPRPAFIVGYRAAPRLSLELRVQDLPVLTGYSYQQELATSYLGFGESYTQDYLYLPVQAAWQVTRPASRWALSLVAGGGPAWTDTGKSLLTPTGTQFFTSSGSGIGTGPTPGPGTVTATVTQRLTQQRGFFVGLEAGIRGTWQVRPRLGLALTVRQLWSTVASARTIELAIQTDTQRLTTTMQTPVRGICTGLSAHYTL